MHFHYKKKKVKELNMYNELVQVSYVCPTWPPTTIKPCFSTLVLHTSYPMCVIIWHRWGHITYYVLKVVLLLHRKLMHISIVKKIIQKNSQRHCSFIKPDYSIFWLFTTDHLEVSLSGLFSWNNRVKEMPWHLEKV